MKYTHNVMTLLRCESYGYHMENLQLVRLKLRTLKCAYVPLIHRSSQFLDNVVCCC